MRAADACHNGWKKGNPKRMREAITGANGIMGGYVKVCYERENRFTPQTRKSLLHKRKIRYATIAKFVYTGDSSMYGCVCVSGFLCGCVCGYALAALSTHNKKGCRRCLPMMSTHNKRVSAVCVGVCSCLRAACATRADHVAVHTQHQGVGAAVKDPGTRDNAYNNSQNLVLALEDVCAEALPIEDAMIMVGEQQVGYVARAARSIFISPLIY